MTDTKDVNVEVRGEDIIITAPGTDHLVIYSKRENSFELRARKLYGPFGFSPASLDLGKPQGPGTGVV